MSRAIRRSVEIPAERLATMTTEEVYTELGFAPRGYDSDEDSISLSVTAPSRYPAANPAAGLSARFPVLLGLVNTKVPQDITLVATTAFSCPPEKRHFNPCTSLPLQVPKPPAQGFKVSGQLLRGIAHAPGNSTPRARVASKQSRAVTPHSHGPVGERPYAIGDTVWATGLIYEWLPNGEPHKHAGTGDRGIVEWVDAAGWPDVRFEKSGTATLVDPEDGLLRRSASGPDRRK